MVDLTELPGIGPKLARALTQAGISDPETLRELGSLEAWRRIHPDFDCLHSLLSLEAAVQGVPKSSLSEDTRRWLKEQAFPSEHASQNG